MTTKHLIRKLSISAVLLVGIGASAIVAPNPAQAATATKIAGTVTDNGARVPGASVGLYRWNTTTSTWAWLGNLTTSNSGGNYAINVASGYYYEVRASYEENECILGGYLYLFTGYSAVFFANAATANAAVPLEYVQQMGC